MRKIKTFRDYLVLEAERRLVRSLVLKDEGDIRGKFVYSKEEILSVVEELSVKGKVVESGNRRDVLGR